MRPERFLQRRQHAGCRRQPLDRAQVRAIDLHGELEAGARRIAVDLDGAGAAHAVLAADMRAGGAEHVAQEIASAAGAVRLRR